MLYYSMAGCQEDLGQFEDAEESYKKALEYEPENEMYIGGLASFLYLHGNAKEALKAYLHLVKLQRERGKTNFLNVQPAIETLAKKLKLELPIEELIRKGNFESGPSGTA